MGSDQLALVMVAGIWAALNTLVSAFKVVNDKRDVIVTGKYEGEHISLEHRQLMFVNDWIPLKLGVAIASLIFSFALFAIPYLSDKPNAWLVWVSYLAAFGPFISFISFSFLGFRDYRFIKNSLKDPQRSKSVNSES
jgi:hypothetical protein